MKLEKLLLNRRSSIIKKWRDVVIGTYPSDAQRFLRKEKNQFANPVGNLIGEEIEILYDQLVKGDDTDRISSCLDNIIRIRAVQDFKPSHAVAFVLKLKDVIRGELKGEAWVNGISDDLRTLEDRIDAAVLLAFDIYSQRRHKIYEIRVNEVKNQVGRLLKRANLTVEIPD